MSLRVIAGPESVRGTNRWSRIKRLHIQCILAATCLGANVVNTSAAPKTDDSPAGMTCQYLAGLPSMAWSKPGGDWIDSKGQTHGLQPFASAKLAHARAPQRLELDATVLVRSWAQPGAWAGALALRGEGGRGSAELASREHAEPTQRPALELSWADGRSELLQPMADSHLGCPHFRSVGKAPVMKLANGVTAVMLFDRPGGWGDGSLSRARLVLWNTRQTGSSTEVGLYAASLPGGNPGASVGGIAARYPGDLGIERDPAVLLVERFEGPPQKIAWLKRDDLQFVHRVDVPDSRADFQPLGGAALAIVIGQGAHRGMNTNIRMQPLAGAEPEELYFRYYLRFGSDWDPHLDGGKLPGFAGTYGRAGWGGRRADGIAGWSARGSFAQQAVGDSALTDVRGIGSYVYHVRKDRHGETLGWNLGAGGWLQKNRWYSIEQHLRLNTPGRNDGVLRAWVDGRLVFERRDLRWRDVDTLRIETLWLNVYHGGAKPSPQEMTLFIDNLVVARAYIGPSAKRP